MKTVCATPRLKEIASKIPASILADDADVQTNAEDDPHDVAATIKDAALRKEKDSVVMFEANDYQLYFLGTIQEVEARLITLGGLEK